MSPTRQDPRTALPLAGAENHGRPRRHGDWLRRLWRALRGKRDPTPAWQPALPPPPTLTCPDDAGAAGAAALIAAAIASVGQPRPMAVPLRLGSHAATVLRSPMRFAGRAFSRGSAHRRALAIAAAEAAGAGALIATAPRPLRLPPSPEPRLPPPNAADRRRAVASFQELAP